MYYIIRLKCLALRHLFVDMVKLKIKAIKCYYRLLISLSDKAMKIPSQSIIVHKFNFHFLNDNETQLLLITFNFSKTQPQ